MEDPHVVSLEQVGLRAEIRVVVEQHEWLTQQLVQFSELRLIVDEPNPEVGGNGLEHPVHPDGSRLVVGGDNQIVLHCT